VASDEAKRMVAMGAALCRKLGIDMKVVSFRTGPEHTEVMYDILDAVRGNPIAESFLDWLLSLAAKDFDEACATPDPDLEILDIPGDREEC